MAGYGGDTVSSLEVDPWIPAQTISMFQEMLFQQRRRRLLTSPPRTWRRGLSLLRRAPPGPCWILRPSRSLWHCRRPPLRARTLGRRRLPRTSPRTQPAALSHVARVLNAATRRKLPRVPRLAVRLCPAMVGPAAALRRAPVPVSVNGWHHIRAGLLSDARRDRGENRTFFKVNIFECVAV